MNMTCTPQLFVADLVSSADKDILVSLWYLVHYLP